MSQGWTIDQAIGWITFFEAPANGASIVVQELPHGGAGGTDVWAVGAWSYRYGYPSEIEFYADRLWFAGTPHDPQTVWASQIGDYSNFGRSSPIVDSDAVTFTINARQVNAIRDLIPLDSLLVLTTGGEWMVTGGQDDVITPSTIGVKPQSYNGISDIPARAIGESALYIQEQGQKIRDISYTFEKDGFRGNEVSVWASHLTEGYTFSRMEYATSPWPILWLVRGDGRLMGCTYMPEQEVIGWHQHDTDGDVLDICCLPDPDETETYFLVRRVINGQSVQYIEQQAPTRYVDQSDYKYLDSCLTYDGRNTQGITLTLTGTGWTEKDALTLAVSEGLLSEADEGNGFLLQNGSESVRVWISEYISATQAVVYSIGSVPASLRNTPTRNWTFQRKRIGGLDHLEGKTVSVLADGDVRRDIVVSGGQIALQIPAGVAQIGLPYRAHIETLEVNAPGGESMRAMKKLLFNVSLHVRNTRGVLVGTSLDLLDPIAQREFEDYTDPTAPTSGVMVQSVSASWGRDGGHFHIVSDDPVPMEILSFAPKVAASD